MKILQVMPTLSAGGAEGFVTNLGVSLANMGEGVRFFLTTGVQQGRGDVLLARLQNAGIEVLGQDLRNSKSVFNVLRLAKVIRSYRPDIVQANMYQAEVLVSAARFASFFARPVQVRRLASTDLVEYRSPGAVRMLDRFFSVTVACSGAVAESYRSFMGEKLRSRVVVIPNGGLLREAVTTAEDRDAARKALGVPTTAFAVAHIGRMFPGRDLSAGLSAAQKAHDVLLRSFASAFGADPDCVLLLVGDGPLKPEAEALAASLGISGSVRFLGQQPEPWPVLNAADMFCFPSRYEGLPNVLPEAASCGLPVVASDIPEIRSIRPGESWLLEPVDDVSAFAAGMLSVRKDHDAYARSAVEAAPVIRDRFSMRACAEKYLEAYESAL